MVVMADQFGYGAGAQARIDGPPGLVMVMRSVVNAAHLPSKQSRQLHHA